jgi:PAS domain S-box-containing protein
MAWDRKFRSPWLLFIVAALLPVCAALLRFKFLAALGFGSPYLAFYPSVLLAALLAGTSAGVLATAISGCLASYLWIGPVGSIFIAKTGDRWEMAVFILSGLLISGITGLIPRAQARANDAAAKARLAAESEQATSRRERYFLRQVIDAFPSNIFVKDEQGILHLVNHAMAKFHGSTVEEMEGKRLSDFGLLPQELQARFREEDREILSSKKGLHSAANVPDAEGQLRCLVTDKSPLFEEDGSCGKLLVVTTDITEHQQAEEALHENQELLNSIITGTPDAIYVKDISGKYRSSTGRRRS